MSLEKGEQKKRKKKSETDLRQQSIDDEEQENVMLPQFRQCWKLSSEDL